MSHKAKFIELKSTDNTVVYMRPEAVQAFEVVPASARVEGHVKIFVSGFKFLIQTEKEELLQKLSGGVD